MELELPNIAIQRCDPLSLKSYVNKSVEIVTTDGMKHHGCVFTIDPESCSVIIGRQKNGNSHIDLIMGHSLKSISVSSTECEGISEDLFKSPTVFMDSGDIQRRREKVKAWLTKNMLPFEENADILKVAGDIEIYPPYGKDQCFSGNKIVLSKVQNLIANTPDTSDEI